MESDRHEVWHKDPSDWILGIFYFNSEDRRIFAPKSFRALGWTINFGNPFSIIAFIAMLAALLILS